MSVCGSTNTASGEPCQQPVAGPNDTCWREGHTRGPGRPTTYDPELADFVCREIQKGRSLRAACRQKGELNAGTVLNWVADDRDGFSERYAHACEIRLHVLSEDLLEISDDGRNDTWVDEDGHEHVDYDVIQRSKLRVNTRKWLLSRLKPEKYSKRHKHELSGEVDTGGVMVVPGPINPEDWGELPDRLKDVSGNGAGGS